MLVTDSLGAVGRTVLETIRTAVVWVLNLAVFYGLGSGGAEHRCAPALPAGWRGCTPVQRARQRGDSAQACACRPAPAAVSPGCRWGEPWTRASWLQLGAFIIQVSGTQLYAVGDVTQEEELRRRGALVWMRQSLRSLRGRLHAHGLRRPMRGARIAGPATRIRTALLPGPRLRRHLDAAAAGGATGNGSEQAATQAQASGDEAQRR